MNEDKEFQDMCLLLVKGLVLGIVLLLLVRVIDGNEHRLGTIKIQGDQESILLDIQEK